MKQAATCEYVLGYDVYLDKTCTVAVCSLLLFDGKPSDFGDKACISDFA